MNKYAEFEEKNDKPIDLIGILTKYFSHWKLFLVSLILCVALAVIYLKFTLPTYEATTSILLKDDQKGGGTIEMSAFKELGLFTQKNNVDNELEVLNKSIIVEQVVRELGMYAFYTQIETFGIVKTVHLDKVFPKFGRYASKVLYGDESPVLVTVPNGDFSKIGKGIEFEILIRPYGEYVFKGVYNYSEYAVKASISDNKVKLPFGVLDIKRGKYRPASDMVVRVVLQNPTSVADHMMDQLKMELTSKTTSVVNISFQTANVNQGKEFLAKLIEVYIREDMDEQNVMANKTAKFIDDRLMRLTSELGDVETRVENYKQAQGIADIKSQADMFIQQTGDLTQKRLGLETQLAVVTDMDNYIHRPENRNQPLPANTGIESQALGELINNYNRLLLQRNKLSRIASSSNQVMIDLNSQIESLFSTVQSSVRNERNNLQIARRDLLSKNSENAARIRAIPRQEREYQEIKRQQSIKEALFLFMLQKKEEKYLNGAIVEPIAKLIDNVRCSDHPVSPMKMFILLASLILGVLIPVVIIKIRDLLRYQIENKEELEKISTIPVLGEIPKISHTGHVIIKENSTDGFSELVRLLRTNLLFVMDSTDKKVINVVSTVGEEGKTFVSVNLAASLALLDKKVLLIGLDIRKPKLAEYLKIDNNTGITLYLTGHLNKNQLIRPSGIHPNLSVITAGPVPPNPSELLSKPALDKLISELKEEYDYIIVDTAPVGLVSDSFTLNRFADANLYVVRADYTHKKSIQEATNLAKNKKLNNLYFVLNAIDISKSSGAYGLSKKYGYGYGYEPEKK
ncbi:MAG: polysaccharide biosynthesis tyrosine autokinase [Paludibacter sp.]